MLLNVFICSDFFLLWGMKLLLVLAAKNTGRYLRLDKTQYFVGLFFFPQPTVNHSQTQGLQVNSHKKERYEFWCSFMIGLRLLLLWKTNFNYDPTVHNHIVFDYKCFSVLWDSSGSKRSTRIKIKCDNYEVNTNPQLHTCCTLIVCTVNFNVLHPPYTDLPHSIFVCIYPPPHAGTFWLWLQPITGWCFADSSMDIPFFFWLPNLAGNHQRVGSCLAEWLVNFGSYPWPEDKDDLVYARNRAEYLHCK